MPVSHVFSLIRKCHNLKIYRKVQTSEEEDAGIPINVKGHLSI